MKKIPVISFWQKILLNEDFDIRHKLQNMLLIVALAGSSLSTIKSFMLNISLSRSVISLFTTLTVFAAFFISVILRKKNAASYLACIAVDLVLLPMLFITGGGIYSSIPLWLLFGLIFPWFIMEGAGCYIIIALDMLAVLVCFSVQIFFPQTVTIPTGPEATVEIAIDMALAIIVIPIILGVTIKYQVHVFERQQHKMEHQEKQLRKAMRSADRSNEAKTTYLLNMSHEIRTPINAVLGMDEMILRECSDETILGYAENIQSAGQSLLSIINDVLDFSKIESGKLEILPVEYDVQQLMNDCYNLIIMRAEKKNLLLEVQNDPALPGRLLGDEVRIRQVILNLLTNAVKYTSAGKVTLELSFTPIGDGEIMLKVVVRDTGMGISQENQKNLFTAFNRFDEMHNRNIEGTGLGLSITKRLTDLMGGRIGVNSVLGAGSVFWVELPQKVCSAKPVGKFIEKRRRTTSQKSEYHERFQAPAARILVVDDVKLNIDVMKGLLKNTKVRIDSAYSGRECLGLAQKNSYDLIFMDHLMPEMDGVETLRQMSLIPDSPNINTPVIALTANAMMGAREKYTEMGFSDYLAKPVQSDKLELMLMQYLPQELLCNADDENNAAEKNPISQYDFSELDISQGIEWCCGDEQLYRQILDMLNVKDRADQLDIAFRSGDWKAYERLCCGLKSSARTVGGERASRIAASLEQQAKVGGITYIRENHSKLIDCCQTLDRQVHEYLQQNRQEEEKY